MRHGHFGSMIEKHKNSFGGYFRTLLYRDPVTLVEGELEQHVRLFGQNKGTIEISQEGSPIASLYFQFGRNLKVRHPGIRENDIYVDAGNLPAVNTGKAYQKQGLATQMFTELIHFAKEKGSHSIYLRVTGVNQNALSVYKKIGFKFVRYIPGQGETLLMMYPIR